MLWAIDCQDYPQALRIGRYVVKHGLSMRDDFKRTAPVLLAEEISNQVLNIATADAGADLSGYVALLDEVAAIVEGSDMPDEVASKLCKARGFSRRGSSDNETKGEALKLFRRATELNPNAGVKREMQALTRDLKKLAVSQPDAAQAEKKPAKTWIHRARVEKAQEKRNALIEQILTQAEHRDLTAIERLELTQIRAGIDDEDGY